MKHVGDDAPPAELGLVLVHGRVVLILVDGGLAAPDLLGDLLFDLPRKAAALEVDGGMNHVVAVEHHVVHGAHLAEALDCMMDGPAAIVDERRRCGVEPFLVVPALAPNQRTVGDLRELGVVLGDLASESQP